MTTRGSTVFPIDLAWAVDLSNKIKVNVFRLVSRIARYCVGYCEDIDKVSAIYIS